jgi:hypothetical protein
MLERINDRLQAEGIRPVEMIILKWRVSQLLRDIQRKFCKCQRTCPTCGRVQPSHRAAGCNVQLADYVECLAEGDMLRQMTVANSASSSPQRSDNSPSDTRPYDPIRDV